ncbi:hypothetical protein BC629DRAFT_1596328 [Irpex lacteus]|nr:hypothetical protein BC629DRAFT_1596328 [Irpex lacteus]
MAPPFYAYIKPVVTPNPETYLMVFSDQATADDWWRAVCTSSMDVLKTKSIKRISPQFYAYDPQQIKINTNRLAGGELRLFADKVFFVALPQDHPSSILPQLGTIPLLDITEHISGNWFYIRSKGRNPVYWYCDTNNAGTDTGALVVASRIHSTRFCITAAEVADVPIGAVMVGKDSVELTFSGGQIQISGAGSLYSADTGEQWKLSKFTNGFRLNGQMNVTETGRNGNCISEMTSVFGVLRKKSADAQDTEYAQDKVSSKTHVTSWEKTRKTRKTQNITFNAVLA